MPEKQHKKTKPRPRTYRCIMCGDPLPVRIAGSREPCPRCLYPYPHGKADTKSDLG